MGTNTASQVNFQRSPVKICWAELLTNTARGYGRVTRELLWAVERAGVEILSSKQFGWDLRVIVSTPITWVLSPKGIINEDLIFHTMYDADLLPTNWVRILNYAQAVWVPSNWCAEVFKKSGVDRPIYVSGYGVDTEEEFGFIEQDLAQQYTFLAMGTSLFDRKGVMDAVRAFAKLNLPDAQLIVKLNSGPWETVKTNRNIRWIRSDLSTVELAMLFARINCLVYPSKGEGFGLIPLEAMATGRTVILTDYSGMQEYIKSDLCLPLRAEELIDSKIYNTAYNGEGRWAKIDQEHLMELMLWAYHNRDKAKAMGERASKYVQENWTWDIAGQKARQLLEAIAFTSAGKGG